MKFIVSLILMAVLSFAICLYLPWWSISIACFVVALFIRLRPGIAFLCGFLSLFILWGGLSFYISCNNNDILAHRISQIILKKDDPLLLIIATGLIGALVAAFAALSGSILRSVKK
ncbi:MAG: hypothetical protein ABIO04_05495 [Ferruginibacter sp.]